MLVNVKDLCIVDVDDISRVLRNRDKYIVTFKNGSEIEFSDNEITYDELVECLILDVEKHLLLKEKNLLCLLGDYEEKDELNKELTIRPEVENKTHLLCEGIPGKGGMNRKIPGKEPKFQPKGQYS